MPGANSFILDALYSCILYIHFFVGCYSPVQMSGVATPTPFPALTAGTQLQTTKLQFFLTGVNRLKLAPRWRPGLCRKLTAALSKTWFNLGREDR